MRYTVTTFKVRLEVCDTPHRSSAHSSGSRWRDLPGLCSKLRCNRSFFLRKLT